MAKKKSKKRIAPAHARVAIQHGVPVAALRPRSVEYSKPAPTMVHRPPTLVTRADDTDYSWNGVLRTNPFAR